MIEIPIVLVQFDKIDAYKEAEKDMEEGMSINSSPTIVEITKEKEDILGIKDILTIKFKFSTDYSDIGKIAYEGRVLYQTKKMEDILDKWSKKKLVEDSIAVEVLNAIFRKCLSKTIDLASELRLPPPIKFPNVVVEKKKDKQAS